DRLDLLGEEYFHYILKPQLKREGVRALKDYMARNGPVALVSQGLEHVMRPLADFLGVERLVANCLEFRDGRATGRLLEPVIRPRGGLALLTNRRPDGRVERQQLLRNLGLTERQELLEAALLPVKRPAPSIRLPLVRFDPSRKLDQLSVREALRGKQI